MGSLIGMVLTATKSIGVIGGIGFMTYVYILGGVSVVIFLMAFWIGMLLDCRRNEEGYEQYSWTIILCTTLFIGAFFYFFTIRRKRIKKEEEEE